MDDLDWLIPLSFPVSSNNSQKLDHFLICKKDKKQNDALYVEYLKESQLGVVFCFDDLVDILVCKYHFHEKESVQWVFSKNRELLSFHKHIKKQMGDDFDRLLYELSLLTFSKAQILSIKIQVKTTILCKILYPKRYLEEIDRFQKKYQVSWSEIGFNESHVSLLR